MGEAFEAARKKLHSAGQPQIVFETIAARIIAAASKGERDPVRYAMPGWPDWYTTAIRPPSDLDCRRDLLDAALGAEPPKPTPTAPDRQRQFRVIEDGRQ